MENGLDAELDGKLSCGKYGYRNKGINNSRNGHDGKTPRTSFGDMDVPFHAAVDETSALDAPGTGIRIPQDPALLTRKLTEPQRLL